MEKISFIESKLVSLSFQTEQEGLEDNLNLKYNNGYSEESDKSFIIRFFVDITTESGVTINLEYIGLFVTDQPISTDFQKSAFPVVNAPAIVFPYLRSFINTFTINAGLPPITLPTVNFQALEDAKNLDT